MFGCSRKVECLVIVGAVVADQCGLCYGVSGQVWDVSVDGGVVVCKIVRF